MRWTICSQPCEVSGIGKHFTSGVRQKSIQRLQKLTLVVAASCYRNGVRRACDALVCEKPAMVQPAGVEYCGAL